MFESKSEYVFLSADVIKKEKNNVIQEYRFLKLADPQTFENYSLPFSEHLDLSTFKRGQKVKLIGSLMDRYGRTQFVIDDVLEVK